ncbi:MAG TPA: Uma2 family endonuclease [Sphingomonas sp.]|jgi:Uma2 family endonuclease
MNDMSARIIADVRSRGARFTTAEFARMCELGAFDDMEVELIDGELQRLILPMNPHASRQAMVVVRLAQVRPLELVRGEIGIDLGDDTVLGCDAALLRAPLLENRWPRPDELSLVVEVSETTLGRDLGLKMPRYAAAGVANCWVIDGAASVVHAFSDPMDGSYRNVRVTPFGEPLSVPGTDATITLA